MDDAFRLRERKRQANVMRIPYDSNDKNRSVLLEKDAGRNFYYDYDVFGAAKKRYPKSYKKQLLANMLRSEHIPFNIFVPFNAEKRLFSLVAASVFNINPKVVLQIEIEYPPKPRENYLNDRTSFDVFCECEDEKARRFFIAVEVKYTEHGHSIGESERRRLLRYEAKSNDWRLYSPGEVESGRLRSNKLRQIWRNHLLAESLYRDKEKKYSDYRSIVLFPKENEYMAEAAADYEKSLSPYGKKFFLGVTYNKLFDAIQEHASSPRAKDWLAYLRRRYIPPINSSV